jgi:hypothetical protein
MSHHPFKPLPQASAEQSTWSDRGIDQTAPKTASGKLHAVAHEVARLEDALQQAVKLLNRARSEPTETDPQFSDELDDAIVAFINEYEVR